MLTEFGAPRDGSLRTRDAPARHRAIILPAAGCAHEIQASSVRAASRPIRIWAHLLMSANRQTDPNSGKWEL